MIVNPDRLGWAGGKWAEFGYLVERTAHAIGPASSTLGRIAAVVSMVRLGTRVIPAGARLLRRHPAASALLVAGLLGALYLSREPRHPARLRVG